MCAAIYKPGKDNLNQTHVLVSGLNPGTTYLFKVFSKNSVNKAANKKRWNYVEKTHRLKLGKLVVVPFYFSCLQTIISLKLNLLSNRFYKLDICLPF